MMDTPPILNNYVSRTKATGLKPVVFLHTYEFNGAFIGVRPNVVQLSNNSGILIVSDE
jgi:hypothetical protein